MKRLLALSGWIGGLAVLLVGCSHPPPRPPVVLSEHDQAVLDDYEHIRAALADDDAAAARQYAALLAAEAKNYDAVQFSAPLLAEATALTHIIALDQARQLFKPLSATLIPMVEGVPGYYVMTSPPGMGGDWIQRTPSAENPYFGRAMLKSGSLKK